MFTSIFRRFAFCFTLGLLLLVLFSEPAIASVTLLHEFAGTPAGSSYPQGSLIHSGGKLYGMSQYGGSADAGTVYSVDIDGSDFTILHHFVGGVNDGSEPYGALILSGSTLYGMTNTGGSAGSKGTVFKVNTDGTGFTLLHKFAGGVNDGEFPYGSLTISGSTLYGMTLEGGNDDLGTIFKVNTDGTGFALMREFAGGGDDGSAPYGSLSLSGTTLYGMTSAGGDNDAGTIFKINTDSSGFTLMHEFAGGANDGSNPYSDLLLSENVLYGFSRVGGTNDKGTIFSINADGTGFAVLHEFGNDGNSPYYGSLALSGDYLFGATSGNTLVPSNPNYDNLFSIKKDGTGFSVHHVFQGSTTDGAAPFSPPIVVDNTLYGTTRYGGSSAYGVVYSIPVPEVTFELLHEFESGDGEEMYGDLTLSGSTLYGMTSDGGTDDGVIFKINTDGSGYARIYEFAGSVDSGEEPYGSLTISGTVLYGMNYRGGDDDAGTIFKINTDGTGHVLLHEFAGGVNDGSYPYGSLTLSSSTLYGMTTYGGNDNYGTIFKINTDGSGFALLHEFAAGANDGDSPQYGSLTLSGSTLYGMTSSGGDSSAGTVFKINTDGSGFTLLHEFADDETDGGTPYGSLTLSGSTLYGMTTEGGDDDMGTVFKINTDGSNFGLLHEFDENTDGSSPYGSPTLVGSTLYGMTYSGNQFSGSVFSVDTDGTDFKVLRYFVGGSSDGYNPYGSLTYSSSKLYGMTYYGGDNDTGTVFKFNLPVVDSTAPTISLTPGTDPTTDTTPSLTGTATEETGTVADVEFQMDITTGDWINCSANDSAFEETSEAFTCNVTTALSAGSHTMYVRATDSSANTTDSGSYSSDTFLVDPNYPTISLTAGTDPTTDTTPTFTGTATDATGTVTDVEFQMDITTGTWTNCTADDGTFDEASDTFSCTVTTALTTNASHTIYVRATDNANNTTTAGNESSDTFTVSGLATIETAVELKLDSTETQVSTSTTSGVTQLGKNTTTGEDKVSVKWSRPTNTSNIDRYIVHYREKGDTTWKTVTAKATEDSVEFDPGEGVYEWYLEVVYTDGSTSETKTYKFEVDETTPELGAVTVNEEEATPGTTLLLTLDSPLSFNFNTTEGETYVELWDWNQTIHYDTMACGPGICDRGHKLMGPLTLVIYVKDEAGNKSEERVLKLRPFGNVTATTVQATPAVQEIPPETTEVRKTEVREAESTTPADTPKPQPEAPAKEPNLLQKIWNRLFN